MKIRNHHISEGIWVVFGQAFSILSSLIIIRILTEKLDPAEYGLLALALSFGLFFSQVIAGPIANSVIRFYSIAHSRRNLYPYFLAIQKSIRLSLKIFIVILFFLFFIVFILNSKKYALLVLLSFSVSSVAFIVLIELSILNASRKRKMVAINNITNSLGKISLLLFCSYYWKLDASDVLVIYLITSIFVALHQWNFLLKMIVPVEFSRRYVTYWYKKMYVYSTPFFGWGIFTWVQQSSDKWILATHTNKDDLGIYAALFQVGFGPIVVLCGVLVDYFEPIFFSHVGNFKDNGRNEGISKAIFIIAIFMLLASLIFSVITYFYHSEILSLFLAERYLKYSYFFPVFILSGGFYAAAQFMTVKYLVNLRSDTLSNIKIGTAIIGIALNLILGVFWGVKGVVWASLIFSIIYFITVLLAGYEDKRNCESLPK